jgi:hypothetical protein
LVNTHFMLTACGFAPQQAVCHRFYWRSKHSAARSNCLFYLLYMDRYEL